jgi:hypothetical protein
MNTDKFSKNNFILFLFTFVIFASKWLISFYFFKESIEVKIISENVDDGWFFLPLIKQFSLLELNNSFSPYIKNLNNLPLSFGSIIFHTIFFKIFGYSGIIIIEFFGILFFLIIFYKIFRQYLSKETSLIFTLLLFTLPALIFFIGLDKISYLHLIKTELFSLRIHRPFPSTLYLLLFTYFLIYIDKKNKFTIKYGIFLGITAGLSLSSFYFYFIAELILIFFWFTYKFKFNFFKKIKIFINFFFSCIISFIIIVIPFALNIFLQEKDSIVRQGVFDLTNDKKIKLLNYNFQHILNLKFLTIFIISLTIIYLINKKKIAGYKLINILYLLFLSSILSPALFVITSPKASLIYHFYNLIILSLFLFLIISLFLITEKFLKKILNSKLYYALLLIFLVSINVCYAYLNNPPTEDKINKRIEFQALTEKINLVKKNKNLSVLTFDNYFMIWLIFEEINHIYLVNHTWVPRTDAMLENDLINAFKILGLNNKDFLKFLENKEDNWRYYNADVAKFFQMKYQANSLNTFKNSNNFEDKIKNFIQKSSPLLTQQIAIPKEEFDRLDKKFRKIGVYNGAKPDLIILDKNNFILSSSKLDPKIYCKYEGYKSNILYIKKNLVLNCN